MKSQLLNINNFWVLLLGGLLIFGFAACDKTGASGGSALEKEQKKNPNYVCDMLSNKIHSISFMMKVSNQDKERIKQETLDLYGDNGYNLIWGENKVGQLLETLYAADEHGLNPKDYQPETIDTLFNQVYKQKKFEGEQLLLNKIDLDLMLTASAMSFMADLSNGRYPHKWDIPKSGKDMSQELTTALANNNFSEAIGGMVALPKAYKGMVKELNRYKNLAKNGGLTDVKSGSLSLNKSTSTSKQLAKHLKQTGDYSEKNPDGKFTEKLKTALKQYQRRNGLSASGSLSSSTLKKMAVPSKEWVRLLELNIDRYRWLPDDLGDKYVFVNVPNFRAELIEKDKTILDTKVVVGDVSSPTAIFADEMVYLVFSPNWHVPTSIAKEELLYYLEYNPNLLIVSDVIAYHKGKVIEDIHSIDWKKAQENWNDFRFTQKPTDLNALGDVKFIFPNKYSIYLHDTSHKEDFAEGYRAMSSGCVRVAKPAEMAQKLLADKGWTLSRVQNAMRGTKENRVNLSQKIPVYLYYLTAWIGDDGLLQTRPDLYRHDRKQLKMIAGI